MIEGSAARDAHPVYPTGFGDRDRFVLSRRGVRPVRDAWSHQGVIVEPERDVDGSIASTATVFLTGRECPWRCVMCDLWQYTTGEDTPRGALPAQVTAADAAIRARGERPSVLKLYNAGSFFDRRAVPPEDDAAIAARVAGYVRLVVESHPLLVSDRTWRLRDLLRAANPHLRLEVAVGLETVHPGALASLNKRITVDDVGTAAAALHAHDVDLRVFLLVHPPFVPPDERDAWLAQSVAFAFACGATVVSLIPTRGDEGAMRALAALGRFSPPSLLDVEHAVSIGRSVARARRLFVDMWELERLVTCAACGPARVERLRRHNLDQRLLEPVACRVCGEGAPS